MSENIVTNELLDILIPRNLEYREELRNKLNTHLIGVPLTGVGIWNNIEKSIVWWVFRYPSLTDKGDRLLYLDSLQWIYNLSQGNKEVLKEAIKARKRYLRARLSMKV